MSALATSFAFPALATASPPTTPDFELIGWRTVILLTPKSAACHDWANDYLNGLDCYGNARVIPDQLLATILDGLAADGLTLASYWRH